MTIIYTVNTTSYDTEKINTKYCETEFANYEVLTYKKEMKDVREEHSIYRSVGICPETKKLLYFSPPKAIEMNKMLEKYPDFSQTKIVATQKIEGTMVNLFYDPRIKSWEIATKNGVGGNYFYVRNNYDEQDKTNNTGKQSTFREMFLDAWDHLYCDEGEIEKEQKRNTRLNDIFPDFPKEYTYSFVLQHPENHIVSEIKTPLLYIVAVYRINSYDNEAEFIELNKVYYWDCINPIANRAFMFPYLQNKGRCDLEDYFKLPGGMNIHNMDDFDYVNKTMTGMGVMFINVLTGDRSYIMNPVYEKLKEIRGNHPNLQYQYFSLCRSNKVDEFLHYFPMYREIFRNFCLQSLDFVQIVHNAYVTYYVNKQGKKAPIPKNIFKHIYKLHHDIYLPSLNHHQKMIITRQVVSHYFISMEPKEMLYHVNQYRKNNQYEENV
jgi:hypothetical protein